MDENINITEKQRYVANFDQKIYDQFKKIAKKNNKSLNWFLNLKIEELKDRIELKKYEENNNYKGKMLYLTDKNHRSAKRCLSRKLSHLVKNFFEYYSCRSSSKSFAG